MVADPTYTPAMREKLETEQIISEAENVMAKQLEYLRKLDNILRWWHNKGQRGILDNTRFNTEEESLFDGMS